MGIVVGCFAVLVGCGAATAQKVEFAEAEVTYRELRSRQALSRRMEGRYALATTGDPRAFTLLRADYDKPEDPGEFVRSLLVTQLAVYYPGEPPVEQWQQWRTANAEVGHEWLWYRALQIESKVRPEAWREVFAAKLPLELRAAALAAGASQPGDVTLDADALGLIMDAAAGLSSRSYERSLLLEGIVELFENVVRPQAGAALPEQARGVLQSLVHMMGERATPLRTQVVMARSLARTLGRENIGPDVKGWVELLSDAPAAEIELGYARRRAASKPGFFGITEYGRSIAYVIDASDSMLQPLTPRELQEMVPLTGANADKEARADARAERAIDWSKVGNRFDAARELLKLALGRLEKDQRFTVILFGDKAEYLAATPRLVTATAANIDKVGKEIDAIAIGPRRAERPHGTLRGATNLHGGLLLAFGASTTKKAGTRRGVIPPAARLDEHGVDTIYVLSDGAPSADNWNAEDINEDKVVTDPETGRKKAHEGRVIAWGPFAWSGYLVADLVRLNMLQRCAIHAVGIGEADYELLHRIAAVGHGTVVQIGKK